MRAHRMLSLVLLLWAPAVRECRAQSGSSAGTPAAVVDSFFRATRQERWRDAARLIDLEAMGDLRDQTVRFMRRPPSVHRITPEEIMKSDPKMPRVVAEYEAARSNGAVASYDAVSEEYANVPNVDSLAALPVEEAAARWLQAQDPRYKMRRSLDAARTRCGLPDSVVASLLHQSTVTQQVLGTVLQDSIAYVLFAERPVQAPEADSARAHSRRRRSSRRASWVMPPPVLTLRRLGARWRIAPGQPFGGWSGDMSVGCTVTTVTDSTPPRSP